MKRRRSGTLDASRELYFTLHENNDLEASITDRVRSAGSDNPGLVRDVLSYAISAMVVHIVAVLLGVAWLRHDRG